MAQEGIPPAKTDAINTLVTWAAPVNDIRKGIPAGTLCRVLEPADSDGDVKVKDPNGTVTWMPLKDLQRSEHDAPEKQALALQQRAADILAKLPKRAPPTEPERTIAVDDPVTGHALGKVVRTLGARLCAVSTPETGPAVAGTPPWDAVPVMSAIERAANFADGRLQPFYDFENSASKKDCGEQVPDRDMAWFDWEKNCYAYVPDPLNDPGTIAHHPAGWDEKGPASKKMTWANKNAIGSTQWMRYWTGAVRSGLKGALLGMATPLPGRVRWDSVDLYPDGTPQTISHVAGERTAVAVSVAGGPITAAEKAKLGETVIGGVIADLTSRDLQLGAVRILWLHFETCEDLLKAMQGYGGIDLRRMANRWDFAQAGAWIPGEVYRGEFDLLRGVPGETPEARRAYLLARRDPTRDELGQRLANAVDAGAAERATELLRRGADPNWGTMGGLISAAMRLNPAMVEALLASPGTKPDLAKRRQNDTALGWTLQFSPDAPTGDPAAAAQVGALSPPLWSLRPRCVRQSPALPFSPADSPAHGRSRRRCGCLRRSSGAWSCCAKRSSRSRGPSKNSAWPSWWWARPWCCIGAPPLSRMRRQARPARSSSAALTLIR